MDKILDCIRQKSNVLLFTMCGILLCVVWGVQLFCLNRTLIVSDEGWYLCLLRDVPNFGASRFQFLFKNIFDGDIYAARLFVWLITQSSLFVLAWGVASLVRYYKPDLSKTYIWLMAILSVFAGNMIIEACPSPNYITLNKIAAAFALGICFIGLVHESKLCMVLSGFFISFLIPIMITNMAILPFLMVAIFIVSHHRWRDLALFICGVISFIVFYLLLIESPSDIVDYFTSRTASTIEQGSNGHGIWFLFIWIGQTLLYLCKLLFVSLLLFGLNCIVKKVDVPKVYKWLGMVIGCGAILLIGWRFIPPVYAFRVSHSIVWTKDLYWITFFYFVIDLFRNNKSYCKPLAIIGLLLAIIPICLCFGTDVTLYMRQSEYWMFLLPVLCLFFQPMDIKRNIWVVGIIYVNLGVFLLKLYSGNWQYDSYLRSSIPVKTIGINQNIKLEEGYVDRLEKCKNIIPQGDYVVSSCSCWGLVALLDYKPIVYNYHVESLDSQAYPEVTKIWTKIDETISACGHCWIMTQDWDKDLRLSLDTVSNYNVVYIDDEVGGRYYRLSK